MARSISGRSSAVFLAVLLFAGPAAALTLPFGLGGGDRATVREAPARAEEAPTRLAQAIDPTVRIAQMEEEMRRLTGKVEEMSFLVLQLQEQLRNTQADNELRFQDLEGGGSTGTASAPERRTEAAPAPGAQSSGDQDFTLGLPTSSQPTGSVTPPPASSMPQDDEIAAILDQELPGLDPAIPGTLGAPAAGGLGTSGTVASISPNGPVEMYSLAYNYLLAGDYQLAENTFRQYAQTYPDSQDTPDAEYWLGESLFAQSKFRDAAEVFLNAQKSHPQSGKAPEMMLKLGMSLARLDNQETACVTYAEVEKRYPQMSDNVKRKLAAEESSADCS